jgi:hypothetical protein
MSPFKMVMAEKTYARMTSCQLASPRHEQRGRLLFHFENATNRRDSADRAAVGLVVESSLIPLGSRLCDIVAVRNETGKDNVFFNTKITKTKLKCCFKGSQSDGLGLARPRTRTPDGARVRVRPARGQTAERGGAARASALALSALAAGAQRRYPENSNRTP